MPGAGAGGSRFTQHAVIASYSQVGYSPDKNKSAIRKEEPHFQQRGVFDHSKGLLNETMENRLDFGMENGVKYRKRHFECMTELRERSGGKQQPQMQKNREHERGLSPRTCLVEWRWAGAESRQGGVGRRRGRGQLPVGEGCS